jgi:hypothetical protein
MALYSRTLGPYIVGGLHPDMAPTCREGLVPMKVAVSGKGDVGKTTIAAFQSTSIRDLACLPPKATAHSGSKCVGTVQARRATVWKSVNVNTVATYILIRGRPPVLLCRRLNRG